MMHAIPSTMKAPADKRAGWLVLQVMITRACSESCFNCSQGSNLAGKPVMMSLDEFEQAVQSLAGFPGIIGVFGGQPTLHPKFSAICQIMRKYVPQAQRGLWTNALNGHGSTCRATFNVQRSNLNVHLDSEAADEFRRDWPESTPYIKGTDLDSLHGSPWVAMKDVIDDEEERWRLIADCDINRYWSACLGVVPGRGLRAYFCEIAYAMAALHAAAEDADDWPDTGLEVVPGWWRQPMAAFEQQVRLHCHSCGIPMRRPGQLAVMGGHEEFSQTHRHIARPKVKDRPVQFVSVEALVRTEQPATDYLPGTTPRQR